MKKISALTSQMNVLTTSQMYLIKGGTAGDGSTSLTPPAAGTTAVGPISATDDEKRRDRPGGGVSTH